MHHVVEGKGMWGIGGGLGVVGKRGGRYHLGLGRSEGMGWKESVGWKWVMVLPYPQALVGRSNNLW